MEFVTDNAMLLVGLAISLLGNVAMAGKLAKIKTFVINSLKAARDGHYSDHEKVQTVNDIIAVGEAYLGGLWFNKSKPAVVAGK